MELSSNPKRARGRRAPARKAFLVVAAVAALAVTVGSSLAVATIKRVEHTFRKTATITTGKSCKTSSCLRDVNPLCVKHACNFLVLGSDTRAGLSKRQQAEFGSTRTVQGQRADTIILVRVDAAHHRTVVLSIPRDLLVPIPGYGEGKINTAFSHGPNVMVQTVERLTGLRINHYIEVNFAGFQALVNTLGGVPICIDKPLIDPLSGLRLPHRGCYNLHGAQALAFVRARHIEGDIIPDFSRIARQQQFIRALINKVLSVGVITRLPSFVNAAKDNLRVDDHLSLYDLQDLSHTLGGVGQKDVYFRVLPATPAVIGGVDYVRLVEPEASQLLERIRSGRPLGQLGLEAEGTPISPAEITVHVLDASSGGKAQAVASYLQRAGFVVDLRPAPPGLPTDTILWGHGFGKQPKVVASYLVNLRIVENDAHTVGAQVSVVIGPHYRQANIPGL